MTLIIYSAFNPKARHYIGLAWLPIIGLVGYLFLTILHLVPSILYWIESCLVLHGILLMLGMSRYVTDSRDQVLSANAAVAAQSAFMARMSHEIRTPMNAVLGMTELLRDTPLAERQRNYLNTIHTAGSALLTILNDILDYAKIESGQMNLESLPLDPAQLAVDSLSIFKVLAEQRGIELICDCDTALPPTINGDPTRLQQILVNLISNALKFTMEGEIVLKISLAENNRIRFAVVDSGEGLTSDEQLRLFKRFSQAHNRVTRQHGGTGLGLAICKELVNLMDGDIGVVSGKGSGSTFWFEIPLQKTPTPEPLPVADSTMPLENLAGKHILIVDDNDTFLAALHALCESWGMHAVTAVDSKAAIAALSTDSNFHIISVDWHMPEIDGIALAKQITTQQLAPNAKILLLTGVSSLPSDDVLAGSGIAAIETKPVLPARLKHIYAALFSDNSIDSLTVNEKDNITTPPLKLLLAEDNNVNQYIAKAMLEKLGHSCECVSDGAKALAAYQQQPDRFDAILMDCEMPVLDGWEATRAIREWEQQQHRAPIFVIALTAHALADERARCEQAGMNDFLSKPLLIKTLQEKLLQLNPGE
ncbi:response regulator [Oceanicoccus sp. KOV_DT_Chl]|uniref:response regulator n=1 Tax=Oceanicoccus sp. KOV_DT_Chl TaxID=1904639 RepID=UPI0013573292|nr:response regulator [Oceanicoccus sp. KOV_DT_Chl]